MSGRAGAKGVRTSLLHCVDVRFVPDECLSGLARPYIPEFGGRVACAGDEDIWVGSKRQAES